MFTFLSPPSLTYAGPETHSRLTGGNPLTRLERIKIERTTGNGSYLASVKDNRPRPCLLYISGVGQDILGNLVFRLSYLCRCIFILLGIKDTKKTYCIFGRTIALLPTPSDLLKITQDPTPLMCLASEFIENT